MSRSPWRPAAAVDGRISFGLLFASLYGAYGTESPFFPSFLAARGLSPVSVGVVLAIGTIMRLVVGPIAGLLADRFGVGRVLAASLFGSGLFMLLYLVGFGFWPLLLVCLLHSVTTSPLTALADAIALRASDRGAFPYGLIRGIGSAGFIAGTLASGLLVQHFGLDAIIVIAGVLFGVAAIPVASLPDGTMAPGALARHAITTLLAIPAFRAILVLAGLVIGSHAMLDGFAVIQWRAAGISAPTIGLLWSVAVASEVVVFALLGAPLLARFGPARCAAGGAVAGVVRWGVLALTTDIPFLVGTQLLHGLTFSLVHLACMQVIARRVPDALAATAQTIYGTLILGIASAALTALSGQLYSTVGAAGFWPMAAICLVAIPFAFKLPGKEAAAPTIV